MLQVGQVIGGKYRILHKIGHGGMSNVYLVLNENANKQWALKEVRKDGGKNQEVIRQNLIAETQILRELRHPNLPSIIDIIQDEDTYLILMDYIEGITLLKKLNAEGAQKEEDVVKWSIQICDVLGYLHSRKPPIIYRDTKPSNIMLKPDGNVVLIDFGTARVYKETSDEDTSWLGTRGYAAPEQFGGHGQTDERTDIYNLGATMYHLVTGHNPSKFPYEMYPIRKWDKNLSSGLEMIILKCTKKNPDERYQDCAELKYALEHYLELEESYIKKQNKHLGIFVATCVAAAACFVSSGIVNAKATKMTNETYSAYIRNAEMASDDETKQLEEYKKAIAVDPSEGQAYIDIIEKIFQKDGNFTQKESEEMLTILGDTTSGSSNEASLQKKPEQYEEFAYKLGLSYFYYYDGVGNKAMAKPWFKIAMESKNIDETKRERAERFYKLADYYDAQGNAKDRAGDNQINYGEYWKELSRLTGGNIVQEDNEQTAIVMYREIAYLIYMHANDFKKAQVKESDMKATLDNITLRLQSDFSKENEDMLNELKDSIADAYTAVEMAFGGEV